MTEFKLWGNEIPYFDEKIKNESNENTNKMYFFGAQTSKKVPTVVIFPGGGYSCRADDHEGKQTAAMFNKAGYNAAVVEYRVTPYHYPAELIDAQRAVKILRYNADKLNIDAEKIIVCGYSAGGHLAGITALLPDICNVCGDEIDKMSAEINGAILGYPVCSSDEKIAHIGSFRNLLGEENYLSFGEFSLEKRVTEKTCPFFIWHTAADDCVPVENSLVLANALISKKVPCELHIYPFGSHGLGLAPEVPHLTTWYDLAAKWIKDIIEN